MNRTSLLSVVVLVGCAAGSAEPAVVADTGSAADSGRPETTDATPVADGTFSVLRG